MQRSLFSFAHLAFLLVLFPLYQIVYAQNQDAFISSRAFHSVKLYDGQTGAYITDFVSAGSGGLSAPQEVVFHPDGSLLVTGRFNTAIKRYDGQTGAFLGDFTSGYTLDNPTKTRIGPDSLLYVSQWGATQNKVVRFDLQTGVFVDEFTETGLPFGMGQAWDSLGYLYVASYGNGNAGAVHRFDTAGNYDSLWIPTGDIQGPVNVWFGPGGDLWVVDWSLGEVIRFGPGGQFIDKPVTGPGNLEGWAFDADSLLYLCDWSLDRCYRTDLDLGMTQVFANAGGLDTPNSIVFGDAVPVGAAAGQAPGMAVRVVPNPVAETAWWRLRLPVRSEVRIALCDLRGAEVAEVFAGALAAGAHRLPWNAGGLAPGLYAYRVEGGGKILTGKVVVR